MIEDVFVCWDENVVMILGNDVMIFVFGMNDVFCVVCGEFLLEIVFFNIW